MNLRPLLASALLLLASFGIAEAQTCSLPYTFANNTIADADQVNANFTALLNCQNAVVVGPVLTKVNELAVWNNTTGTLLKDTSNKLPLVQDTNATGARFEIDKRLSPLDYSTSHAGFVLQLTDTGDLGSGIAVPAAVFDMTSTGNGVVNPATHSSLSNWWGIQASFTKSGDGSGQAFTAIGNLGAVGAGGYNELGLFQGTNYNTASTNATLSGVEIIIGDSPDGGGTLPGPTELSWANCRIAKYNTDRTRRSTCFYASSEGSVTPDSVMSVASNANQFQAGIDFTAAVFGSGFAMSNPINSSIGWKNSGGTLTSQILLDGSNILHLGYGPAGGASPNQVQSDGVFVAEKQILLQNTLALQSQNAANNAAYNLALLDASNVMRVGYGPTGGATPLDVAFGGAAIPGALVTTATSGFPFMPTTAGLPTGVPTHGAAGMAAVVVDTTNHKICWYEVGVAWKCAAGV